MQKKANNHICVGLFAIAFFQAKLLMVKILFYMGTSHNTKVKVVHYGMILSKLNLH